MFIAGVVPPFSDPAKEVCATIEKAIVYSSKAASAAFKATKASCNDVSFKDFI